MVRKFPWRRLCVARWEQREAQSGWRTLQARLEKLPARQLDKVKSNNEAHSVEAQREKESPLCHTDGHLSSQNSELEPKDQKYQGRVALRGDIVKDDSGAHAVFTEQGSSASQMTAAKVTDVIARLAWLCRTSWRCSSAHQNFSKSRSHSVHIFLDTSSTDTNDQHHWQTLKNPVVLLERNLHGHPFAGLLCERQFEEVLLGLGLEKVPNWECLFVHRKQGLFLSVYVDDIKMAGRKRNMAPMWKNLMKLVDLGEPASFLDHVYLGCTQRECKVNKIRKKGV